jgi:hypothetical protein
MLCVVSVASSDGLKTVEAKQAPKNSPPPEPEPTNMVDEASEVVMSLDSCVSPLVER